LGLGALTQGFLEMSNVKPIEEMVALIATQRAYEQATRVMEAANQMLGQTSNIRT
jgi:flagellar basal-body rod protein FlgG